MSTFRMLVLGDSYAWGQGLIPDHKTFSFVANWIRQGRGVTVQVINLAHSGATIGIKDNGERGKSS